MTSVIDHKEQQDDISMVRDDLSDVGTERAEVLTLADEDLPSYVDEPAASTTATATASGSTSTPVAAQYPQEKTSHARGPSTAFPLDFPGSTSNLPSYDDTVDIARPIAIPQVAPTPEAPFLQAYPPELLSYGVPQDSWYAFVSTLSDFVSAKVSKQALHHASDVASTIGNYHKSYVKDVKTRGRNIAKEAKRFNPLGVVGGATGLFFGGISHVIGSIFNVPLSMLQNPKTPRDRATVYVTAANKKWFHGRDLHALLLDTEELANIAGVDGLQLLTIARDVSASDTRAAAQMAALQTWLGKLDIPDGAVPEQKPDQQQERPLRVRDDSWFSSGSSAVRSGSDSAAATQSTGDTSVALGKKPSRIGLSQLRLGWDTMWLVIVQESRYRDADAQQARPSRSAVYDGT